MDVTCSTDQSPSIYAARLSAGHQEAQRHPCPAVLSRYVIRVVDWYDVVHRSTPLRYLACVSSTDSRRAWAGGCGGRSSRRHGSHENAGKCTRKTSTTGIAFNIQRDDFPVLKISYSITILPCEGLFRLAPCRPQTGNFRPFAWEMVPFVVGITVLFSFPWGTQSERVIPTTRSTTIRMAIAIGYGADSGSEA